jgi:uncharacterized membrane protein
MQNPPPVQTSNTPPVPVAKSSTGLDENIAALLSYIVHFVSGLIFFLVEKDSRLVRFHAMQAIILGGVFFIGSFVLLFLWFVISVIAAQIHSLLGTLVGLVLGLLIVVFYVAFLAGWVMGMVKAFQGQYYKLPVIGNFAEKFSAK